jgi:hypothetical protein
MAGKRVTRAAAKANGLVNPLRLDPVKAQGLLQRVNDQRARLHERLLDLQLFGDPNDPRVGQRAAAKPGDHPLLQILFKLRDELSSSERAVLADSEKAKIRTSLLTSMARTTESLSAEASKASVEVARIAEILMTADQRAKEHREKMELLRDKQAGVTAKDTTADLVRRLLDGEPHAPAPAQADDDTEAGPPP